MCSPSGCTAVRSGASGGHYTSTGVLPLVPGIDGVGRRDDGGLVYFVVDDDTHGSMAQRVVVDARRTVALPAGVDVDLIAAAMNPAMSSWVALRRRVPLAAGRTASSCSARPATQARWPAGSPAGSEPVASWPRAETGAAPGRGSTLTHGVQLTDDADATGAALAAAAAEVDVVLDYLWGAPAERALMAVLTARADRSRRSTGCRSAPSPVRRSSCPRWRCARRICACWATDRVQSRPPPTWPNSHP